MARPEAAAEPSMDEILASIRKIIAEDPVGSRPKPALNAKTAVTVNAGATASPTASPTATTAATMAGATTPAATQAASPRQAMFVDPPLPIAPAAPAAARADAPKTDPMAAAMARAAQAAIAEPVTPSEATESARKAAAFAAPAFSPPAASQDDAKLFGRLAEALRGGPVSPAVAETSSEVLPPEPATAARPASTVLTDDLDDLLADVAPAAPAAETVPAAMAPATPAKADANAIADTAAHAHTAPAHEDKGEARAIQRRTLDFGSVVPQRPEAGPAAATGVADSERHPVKPSAHALAFDKMLSARMSTGKQEPVATEPEPTGPVVIAAMPDTRDTANEASSEGVALEIEDAEASEAAKSAFGALMAGLAASTAAPVVEKTEAASAAPVASQPSTVNAHSPVAKVSTDSASGIATSAQTPAAAPTPAPQVTVTVTPAKSVPQMKAVASVSGKPASTEKSSAGPMADTATVTGGGDAAHGAVKPAQPSPELMSAPVKAEDASAPAQSSLATAVNAPPAPAAVTSPSPALPAIATPTAVSPATAAPAVLGLGGVRTVEDIVAELLRPMLREWLAENMPRMVEKALRIELAEGLKTVTQTSRKPADG